MFEVELQAAARAPDEERSGDDGEQRDGDEKIGEKYFDPLRNSVRGDIARYPGGQQQPECDPGQFDAVKIGAACFFKRGVAFALRDAVQLRIDQELEIRHAG
ncbi:hypothetical protein [Aromatoleum diolicum]|uniref:Uncharacterized protein n=1 Tax=Aromatoleum diolicum TaxID=75796 RepID=A0ABX1QHZ3_9RHOO|nr:hypothetical protein [Aromatoleum diolicum]NMG77670.1 hypothetical protein [Aromatoleum diolicum]